MTAHEYRVGWRSCELGHAEIAHPTWRQCPVCEIMAKCRAIESVLQEIRTERERKHRQGVRVTDALLREAKSVLGTLLDLDEQVSIAHVKSWQHITEFLNSQLVKDRDSGA